MTNRSLGIIVLCVWLILSGLFSVSNFTIDFAVPVLAFMAIAAGVLILFGR